MKYPDNRILFTVKDVTRACGISRATLLRMEESGFLVPYHIDPDSGYRYYDANNIAQVGQYLLFMELGLSRKEATDLYYHQWDQIDAGDLLARQKLKINRLQRLLNQLEVRYDRSNDFSFSYVELPETTCICTALHMSLIRDIETLAYDAFQNVVKEGFRVQVTEPLFILMPDASHTDYTLCIPVISSELTDSRLRIFPSCRAISITAHGDLPIVRTLIDFSHAAFSSRNLKAAGQERLIALVAPYVGQHIDPKDHCYEYAIPIEEL